MAKSVLFVCLGNICRSPTGEGVLQHAVDSLGLGDQIKIDSAGTIGVHHGNPADARMMEHASRRGYQLLSRSRKISADDLHQFDLVIAMDRDNYRDTLAIDSAPTAEVKLLSDFLCDQSRRDQSQCDQSRRDQFPIDVPDPYYGGAAGFETVLDMIEAACPAIIEHLQK